MSSLQKLINFLDKLEESKIYYKLNKVRDSILVEIAVPGERWEVEFFADGHTETEIFRSNGEINDNSILQKLFDEFSDN